MALLYRFPQLYDFMVEKFFNFEADPTVEQTLADALQVEHLKPGALVLDVACGTGIVALSIAEARPDVQVIGVDISKPMVERATQATREKGIRNVFFIHKPANEITLADLKLSNHPQNQSNTPLEMIVCAYGFTAMPNAETVFQHTLSFLTKGGAYVMVDVYYPQRQFFTVLARYCLDWWLHGANQFSQPWLFLQRELSGFVKHEKPIEIFGVVQGICYLASGIKA